MTSRLCFYQKKVYQVGANGCNWVRLGYSSKTVHFVFQNIVMVIGSINQLNLGNNGFD